ncbi:hypothetical protein UCDDS831_g01182 [Diplodia seriata]|uniref:Uncharacterized protein n=1 Tax=Diplodia seriata TaxID=420778 RepID=A0A0G2EV10_9PEZI|nr:hypothetical protein UCDDS831_g01182 [Diplodia seriata]
MPRPGPHEGSPTFFVTFNDYTFNSSRTVLDNFKALATKRGWGVDSKLWRRQWRTCFNRAYTDDQNPFDDDDDDDDDGNSDDSNFSDTDTSSSDFSNDFTPNPTVPLHVEFKRMALHEGLKFSDDDYASRRARFFHQQFNHFFGEDRLGNYQKLCRIVGVPVGPTVTQCKKELKDRHVMINLVNLVNHMRTLPSEETLDSKTGLKRAGEECNVVPLIKFENFASFRHYTRKHTFPRERAKADGFINTLLRVVS